VIDPTTHDVYAGVSKGAYVLEDVEKPQVVLMATGSEVWRGGGGGEGAGWGRDSRARGELPELEDLRRADRRRTRRACCRRACRRLAVEAGATLGWWKYVGLDGDVLGVDRFGASAPGPKDRDEASLDLRPDECGGSG
jgi:transketolase